MNTLQSAFGGMFVLIAVIFAFGASPRLARRFYPDTPGLPARLAAPVIFALLAAACFLGLAVPALCVTVALGAVLIIVSRWKGRGRKPIV